MTLGVVARADQSGLAQLTHQVIDRLKPDRVLVVDLGAQNRGRYDAHRYHDLASRVFTVQHPDGWNDAALHGFLGGLTHCFSAETFYAPRFPDVAVSYGVRTHLYVMPELFRLGSPELRADRYWYPCDTGPQHPMLRGTAVGILPWWSPTEQAGMFRDFPDPPLTFIHPTGAAMEDRNGTRAVLAACEHLQYEADVIIVGHAQRFGDQARIGKATVRRMSRVDDWTDLYRLGDVLLLPRRYGWLSLPMYEAAAFGMPVITTDLWPQSAWFADFPDCLVRTNGTPEARNMKGGSILIAQADPLDLARAMDRIAYPGTLPRYGSMIREWASAHDWPSVAPAWKEALTR